MELSNLVFLHGWGTDPSVWRHQVEYFSKKYKIETPSVSLNYQLPITNYQLPVLIAWSYGGMPAIQMVLDNPQKFKALVLTGSAARFTDGMNPIIIKKLKKDLERDFEAAIKNSYRTFFSAGENSYADRFINGQKLPDKKATIDLLDELMMVDLREALKDINIPTLIIHGDKDAVCPLAAGEFLHKNIKNSAFRVIKGAGHMPFYTRPEEFNETVEDFLVDVK